MRPLDYSRSSFITVPPHDEVRFQVESRTRIVDEETGNHEDFLQAASCKSERSFVQRDIFLADNYDFLPVVGPKHVVVFRRKAWINANYRTVARAIGFFGNVCRNLPELHSCKELTDHDAIFQATRNFQPLVAQTEIWSDALKLRAIIEYPVKTMNAVRAEHYRALAALVDNPMDIGKEHSLYQIDTGPVAFPGLSERCTCPAECLRLAFVAFNMPDAAEFIIEEPTPIADCGGERDKTCRTRHYMRRLRLAAKNRIYTGGL